MPADWSWAPNVYGYLSPEDCRDLQGTQIPCQDLVRQRYDNSVFIFFMSIWAVYTPVFLYYLVTRRAKFEYALMLLFSVGKFIN